MKWPEDLNGEMVYVPGTQIRICEREFYNEVLRHGYEIPRMEWRGFLDGVINALSIKLAKGDLSLVEAQIPNAWGKFIKVGLRSDFPFGAEFDETLLVYDLDESGDPIIHITQDQEVDFYNGTRQS